MRCARAACARLPRRGRGPLRARAGAGGTSRVGASRRDPASASASLAGLLLGLSGTFAVAGAEPGLVTSVARHARARLDAGLRLRRRGRRHRACRHPGVGARVRRSARARACGRVWPDRRWPPASCRRHLPRVSHILLASMDAVRHGRSGGFDARPWSSRLAISLLLGHATATTTQAVIARDCRAGNTRRPGVLAWRASLAVAAFAGAARP